MISVLARLGSPQLAGQYALGVAVSAPILVLAQFRNREPGGTDIRITSLALSFLGIAAVGFLNHTLQDRMALLLVVLAESVEWIASLYCGRRGVVSSLLHGFLSLAVLAFFLNKTGHFGFALLAVLIVRLLVLFGYDFRNPRLPRSPEDREASAARLAANVPCYFIAHMLGYAWLGVFAVIQSVLAIANPLVRGLAQRATPAIAKLHDDGDGEAFRQAATRLAGTGLVLGLCVIAGAAIAIGTPLALALSAAAGLSFVSTLLDRVLIAGRRGDERMPLEIFAVAASSLACVALVPKSGLQGAACAAGFGGFVRITGQLCVLRSILRRPRRSALLALLKAPLV